MERWIDGWLFGWSVGLLAAKPFGDYLFSFHMPPNSSGLTYNYGSLGSPVVSLFFNFFPRSSSAKWINIFTGFLFLFFFGVSFIGIWLFLMELKALPRVFQVDEQIIYRFLVQLLLMLLPLFSLLLLLFWWKPQNSFFSSSFCGFNWIILVMNNFP